jgi:hypothetical protein
MDSPEKTELKTLAACINKLQADGFAESFMVREGKLTDSKSEKSYEPHQVKVINFYRFEGESDPADNSILYAIETSDGTRGMLTDAYGAYADESTSKFLRQVEEIMKQTTPGTKA